MINFFRNLFRPSIRRQVMAVIESKIKTAQEDYNIAHDRLDTRFGEDVSNLKGQLIIDKEVLLERHVKSILGKIL